MSNANSRAPERPFVRLHVDELKDPRRLDLPDHLQAIHLLLLVHSIREDSKQPWTKGRDGEVLISVEYLAALRKCSPSTIRRAHRELIEKGFCRRSNGKLWVLPVPTGAAPDAQTDDLEAARDAHGAASGAARDAHGAAPDARETAPDAQKAAPDAHSMCISCRPEDANDAMNPCGRRAAVETGDASDSIQKYQNVSDSFISHCGEATTTQTTDDDEVGFCIDQERRDESEGIPTVVPRIQAVAVAVAVVPGAPEVPARQQRRDDGDTTPPIPPPPPGVSPPEDTGRLVDDTGSQSVGSTTSQVADPVVITLQTYLVDTVGVSKSGVEKILALGIDDLRIRQASVFALDKSNSNPGAYLCSCFKDPTQRFWDNARRTWTNMRDARQSDIDAVICQHGLFARQSVAEALGISDTDVFALGLTFDNGMTLESAMVEMYLGRSAGASDNDVLGGVSDFCGCDPAIRLLANYGEPLTQAFLSAAGKEPIAVPPELEQRVCDATERFPTISEAFDGQIIAESISAAEAAERDRKMRVDAEAETERARKEAEDAERRLRENPTFVATPKDEGLILEMGEVLNTGGVVALLEAYGIPASWELLRTMFRRAGKQSHWADGVVDTAIAGLVSGKDIGTIQAIIDATGTNAPYPKGFFHRGDMWTRRFPDRFGPPIPEYREGEMRDYTSLTDEPDEDWVTPEPAGPPTKSRSPRTRADW